MGVEGSNRSWYYSSNTDKFYGDFNHHHHHHHPALHPESTANPGPQSLPQPENIWCIKVFFSLSLALETSDLAFTSKKSCVKNTAALCSFALFKFDTAYYRPGSGTLYVQE